MQWQEIQLDSNCWSLRFVKLVFFLNLFYSILTFEIITGKFKPGDREGFILKMMDQSEYNCLKLLQTDLLSRFVPRIDSLHKDETDGKIYIELQDLLYGFQNPSIMDIKIGVRTFLEDEYMDEKESKPRKDLYQKMFEIDPDGLTEAERESQVITKRRFMSWREVSTSSRTLGFRVEAIKVLFSSLFYYFFSVNDYL